jgi:hypothetical protein
LLISRSRLPGSGRLILARRPHLRAEP